MAELEPETPNSKHRLSITALLHGLGHFTSEFGMFSMDDIEEKYHEEAGAKVLEWFFSSLVINCVRLHVAAKRYLCAARPEYYERLSDASIHLLNLQGGPMSAEEVSAFEKNPTPKRSSNSATLMTKAKVPDMKTPDFAPMVQRVVDGLCGGGARASM